MVQLKSSSSLDPSRSNHLPVIFLFLVFIISACSSAPEATATATQIPATETAAVPPSETPTAGITATLAPVSGEVDVANASCRVGPGGGYLLRAVLHTGDAVEILGQMERNANWILVRVVATSANCWINTSLVEFPAEGGFNIIRDPHIVLPYSDYYSPLRGVTATRNGDIVRVRWDPMVLRKGDDPEDTHFVLVAWVCQNGNFVFRTAGTDEFAVNIRDETGCSELSHGMVLGAEKRGYTQPVQVQWP